jgi:hypothetical protein
MIRSFIFGPVIRAINRLEGKLMAALDDLTNEVSEATSATTLISGLKQKLDEAIAKLGQGDNGEALNALSQKLDTSANDLAAAVEANTPVEGGGEEPAPAPVPEAGEGGAMTDTLITPAGARVPRR